MALATADARGVPDVRMVLLKHADDRGFVFYTNLESPKARQLAANPRASLCFYWSKQGRQVRIAGDVTAVAPEEADAYFATRPRLSQLGAWVSRQSQPMATSFELEKACAAFAWRHGLGRIERPPFWSGFRVAPESIEFWSARAFRLHERARYVRADGGWRRERLFP